MAVLCGLGTEVLALFLHIGIVYRTKLRIRIRKIKDQNETKGHPKADDLLKNEWNYIKT